MDMQKLFSLEGKTALVTGGAYGIGFAIAQALAGAGAKIAFNCRSQSNLDKALADYKAQGIDARGYIADVTDEAQVKELISKIEADLGGVDILVNNAGITKDGLLMKMSEEDFDSVIDINLKGAFHTIRHMSRYFLKQRSGKIINISSVSGILGNAGQANYSASKAGVIGLTKSTARELASRGIQVNAIAPGFIETDMTDAMQAEAKERMTDAIPLKRIGKPEEIADLAVFLASAKSDYITGQVIAADGGMSI